MSTRTEAAAAAVIVVVGGGIAGTTCVETLFQIHDQEKGKFGTIILISLSNLVKRPIDIEKRGRNLEYFNISQCNTDLLSSNCPTGLKFIAIQGEVIHIDSCKKLVVYRGKAQQFVDLNYDYVCLCIGSRPKQPEHLFTACQENGIRDRLISLRDTATIDNLKSKLTGCKRLAIIGNGGISLELAARVTNCSKVWIIRDKFIGTPFLDSGAAKFLIESENHAGLGSPPETCRYVYHCTTDGNSCGSSSGGIKYGASLGPDWSSSIDFGQSSNHGNLEIVTDDEVVGLSLLTGGDHQLRLKTKANAYYDCDLAIMAIGVVPNKINILGVQSLDLSEADGGIIIDSQMQTSIPKIYAAGDVVSCERWPESDLWFQMRLWSQAKQMGHYAAQCIDADLSNEDPKLYFNFDCFTHCTSFFGHKLVLLGRFNDQARKSDADNLEALVRVDPMKHYVKILVNPAGQIVGSLLIGDTGLEETIENLIHDRLDVSEYKYELLDDRVDIEDYFD